MKSNKSYDPSCAWHIVHIDTTYLDVTLTDGESNAVERPIVTLITQGGAIVTTIANSTNQTPTGMVQRLLNGEVTAACLSTGSKEAKK